MVNNSWLASGVKDGGEIPALNGSIPGVFFGCWEHCCWRQLGHFPSIHGADSREKFWDILQKPWSLGPGLSHIAINLNTVGVFDIFGGMKLLMIHDS